VKIEDLVELQSIFTVGEGPRIYGVFCGQRSGPLLLTGLLQSSSPRVRLGRYTSKCRVSSG